jgi:hypothetical protein
MACLFLEQKKARFISELLEAKILTMEKEAKLIELVLWQTRQVLQCYIHYMENA